MSSAERIIPSVGPRSEVEQATEHLTALMDELIAVIVEENAVLAGGLPASLSTLTARKNELADELEQWVKDVTSQKIDIRGCRGKIRQTFVERLQVLRTVMDENIERLRTAMDASRRRIDAIMQAIRREVASASSSYGSDGRADKQLGQSVCGVSVSV